MRAHWRHLANTIKLVNHSPQWSPQSKRQIDRFSSLNFTMAAHIPQNCPLTWGIWTPSNTRLLGPIRAHRPNGTSISLAVLAQMTAECPYTLQWFAFPLKIAHFHGDLDPLRGNFQNCVPTGFTTSPIDVLCSNFVKFGRREGSKFHPNRFTFGGVIDKRVNTVEERRKVNQILG